MDGGGSPAKTRSTEEDPDHLGSRTQRPAEPPAGQTGGSRPSPPEADDQPEPDDLHQDLEESLTEIQKDSDPLRTDPDPDGPCVPGPAEPAEKGPHPLEPGNTTGEPKPDSAHEQSQVLTYQRKDLTDSTGLDSMGDGTVQNHQTEADLPGTTEGFCHQGTQDSSESQLCGFLQKQGGPLRTWKLRWFTYEDQKNQLFYYRTPQDVTPLGRVDLSSATFTYPLKAETGTFHIKTAERTFTLKALTQELRLYWLQQLQVKRWTHRLSTLSPEGSHDEHKGQGDFLPLLKSPVGLVGAESASVWSPRTLFGNMSIKHPIIELQNSVHSLRKRSSQEWNQSVFYLEASMLSPEPSASSSTAPPPSFLLADPADPVTPAEGRESPPNSRGRKTKSWSMMSVPWSFEDRTRLQQENRNLRDEVQAQKDLVWILHKALEESQREKRTCAEFLAAEDEKERLELLRHGERRLTDLHTRLDELRTELEETRGTLSLRDAQILQLQDNVRKLEDKNEAKKEVIIKLADHMTTCLSNPPHSASPSGGAAADSQVLSHLQHENENLQDDIDAYKTQNTFLNSEIFQLTKLWRRSSEQEKSLMVKCAHLEASNCQVESRYLGVLQKLQETKCLDSVQRGTVQTLIEDALRGQQHSGSKVNTNRVYDEYGFKILPDYEVDDMKLLTKIQALEIRSHNLLNQEGQERPLLGRWAHYLAGRTQDGLCPSQELKCLLRGGVPHEYRQRLWRWMVRTRTRTFRDDHPRHYQQLCEKSHTSSHPAARQIQLDLHRTLTTNQHFSSPSSPSLQQLRRILLAFSWHNPAIGYCQGLNRLAAIALLVLQDEEDAFWCLVSVVETIMPEDYYTKNLVSSQVDQLVLKDFLVEKLPCLASHFDEHNVDASLVTFNWFLVVFVENLPSDILLPLWDSFLYEGTKVMFRYTLALFKYKENQFLKIKDGVELNQFLRFFTKTICDSRRLTCIAFNEMNPFPGRLLRSRRRFHLERLQAELHELEEQQREVMSESVQCKHKDVDGAASEDDEEL